MANASISLQPATLADVPEMARFAGRAFDTDRHTQLKELGKVPYNHEKGSLEGFPEYLANWKCVFTKAVDDETGEILGFSIWGFRGLTREEIPRLGNVSEENVNSKGHGFRDEVAKQKETSRTTGFGRDEILKEEQTEDDPLKRLAALTDGNMAEWMQKLMPEGTRCMYVVGLTVNPEHQRRGIASKLLKWGTDTADAKGIFIWVHSSEAGVAAYSKAGFEPIGTLDVDLDEYAPGPPPEAPDGNGKWGHYIFTWMKYFPKSVAM
ncbi:acyl-CoA N-acyltransferase [Bisporella sp. PMI_857]|nr:acyl-CoA N-acyltransferase [Bisporella sp. PMI_857]